MIVLTVLGFGAIAGMGTLLRWDLATRLQRPAGTLLVNMIGTFALGVAAGLDELGSTLVGVAGMGALTTFSTVMLEIIELWYTDRRRSILYAAISTLGGLGAAWIGLSIAV